MSENLLRILRTVAQADPAGAALLLVSMLLSGLQPYVQVRLMAHLIDSLPLVLRGQWPPILYAVGALALVMLVGTAADLASGLYLQMRLRMTLGMAINQQLMERAAAAPLLDLESPAFHDRLNRAMRAREPLFGAVGMIEAMLKLLLRSVSILGLLATLQPSAVLLFLAGSVPAWLMQKRTATAQQALFRRQAEPMRRISYLSGLLTGRPFAQEVRLFGLGEFLLGRYRAEVKGVAAERLQVATQQGIWQGGARTAGNLAFVGALGLLGARGLAGGLSVGQFGAIIPSLQNMQGMMGGVMDVVGRLQQDLPLIQEIWSFLDETAPGGRATSATGALAAAALSPLPPVPVEFHNVTFQYPGSAKPTLRSISFQGAPGELIAIVGENGAGKSTLVKLLLGLYPASAGQVTVDGVDVASPAGAAVRPRIGAVFQEYLRYALTAGENIALGDVERIADQDRIVAAARATGADQVIEGLPQGYATRLRREFDGGQELSGGQWQKLAIARAFMREASVLVLDEPTAALDPQAELEVFQQFRALAAGRTAFFIAHRLGAARLADRILVLKHGELVEVGHHDELVTRGGEYAALFEAQAQWYR